MKVLLLNGSSNLKGCTYTALEEIAKTLQEEGIDIMLHTDWDDHYPMFQVDLEVVDAN